MGAKPDPGLGCYLHFISFSLYLYIVYFLGLLAFWFDYSFYHVLLYTLLFIMKKNVSAPLSTVRLACS